MHKRNKSIILTLTTAMKKIDQLKGEFLEETLRDIQNLNNKLPKWRQEWPFKETGEKWRIDEDRTFN
jgi:hypothetical protein